MRKKSRTAVPEPGGHDRAGRDDKEQRPLAAKNVIICDTLHSLLSVERFTDLSPVI